MKHTVITAIFLLTMPLIGRAQVPGYPTGCARCSVISYVDLPAAEATVSASDFVLHGWGFECESGRPADRVDVFVQDYRGYWRPLKAPALDYGSIMRDDVQQAYAPYCPSVASNTGWSLRVPDAPLGLRRVQINVWRGPYYEVHRRTYLIVP